MADQQALIEQFVGVTGVDTDRAKFHLESAAWNLELAMASFYEDGEGVPEIVNIEEDEEEEGIVVEPKAPSSGSTGRSQAPPGRPGGSSRFATIASMKSDSDSNSSEDGEAFYAGGSERSGQQILGPRKKKTSSNEMVNTLFQSAKEHGAEVVDTSERPRARRAGPSFKGTGYRLGDTEGESDAVPGTHVERPSQVNIVLKLWKGGFSVDGGTQRDYNDPANKEFLASISKGEIPKELIRMARGGEVNLNMEDHRNEDFVKPKVSMRAFTGEGHMLGSPAPNVTGIPPEAAGASASGQAGAAQPAVDESKPSTSIQIRLADGTRLVAKFNHSHRISDIRNYILSSRPQYAASSFVLMTTFPNNELSDEALTIQEANLMNAVIVQRQK